MRNNSKLVIAAIGALYMVAGPSFADDHFIMDVWYRQPESVTDLYQQEPVAENAFTLVKEEQKAKAVAALEKDTFRAISEAEALEYGVKTLAAQKHFYLVRAITLNRPHGVYSLYFAHGALLVRYSTMGNTVPPTEHEALVVALPKELKEAYVIYHVVQ